MRKLLSLILVIIILTPNLYSGPNDKKILANLKKELESCSTAIDSVKILCRIAWNYTANKEESLFFGKLALETSKSISDSTWIANTLDAAGVAYLRNDSLTESKELLKNAIAITERNNFKTRAAWAYYHLALVANSEGNRSDISQYLRKSISYFKESKDFDNEKLCYWLFIKTRHENYQDTLISILEARIEQSTNNVEKIEDYLELANLYNKTKDKNKELLCFQQVIELADKNESSTHAMKAYWNIANYFKDFQQNYPQALTYYLKALDLEKSGNRKESSELLSQIGETYMHLKNDSLALQYLNKGLEISKKAKHRHSISSALMSLGEMNYQSGNYKDAIYYFGKCYETGCDVCPQIKFHDALVKIGNAYSELNDFEKAKEYYMESLSLAESASDKQAKSTTYLAFGDLAIKQNHIRLAEEDFITAFVTAEKSNYLYGQQKSAFKLSELYNQHKEYENAYHYLSISNELSDSIAKINEAENLAKLETHFDFQNLKMQNELEKVKSDEEIASQKLLRNFFIGGFALLSLLILLVYKNYKRKKRDNVLLEKQKVAIEDMSKKVHEADQTKLDFFTNVSHELKTPLTLILGMTEKLDKKQTEKRHLNTIRNNSLRLLQLINHLLDLRKLDASKMELHVSETDLHGFLKGLVGSFEEFAYQKKIRIEFISDQNPLPLFFDRNKLEKIISNLLSNAIKYNSEGGWIKLTISKNIDENSVNIEVTDNGIGISQKDQKNIFSRFYRVSDQNNQGSGIGLAYTKELVELHKGTIKVNSKPNEGSTFTVTIPTGIESYFEHEITHEEAENNNWNYEYLIDLGDEENEATTELDIQSKTILIVEDNNDLRKYIASIFNQEFQIIEAENGEEGIKLAQSNVPDIIISDVVMPKMSGLQLIEKVKNHSTTSHIPIILLTAKNDISTRLLGFEKGADEYISKPFDSSVLKSRVNNLLRLRTDLVQKFSKQFHLQPREILIENTDKKFIQETIDVIERHISNPALNIDLLTIELRINRTQLYRKLKALTDYSANQFIRIIRLKRAAQLLENGQNNIAEVMDATGFSNYSHFNSCFKEFFGKSPKEYALVSINSSMN